MGQHEVFLGLGSNLGRREAQLLRACDEIERLIGPVAGRSAFIETEPWGYESANRFLNAVVRCHTELEPLQVLDRTQAIERMLGKRAVHATKRGERFQLNGEGCLARADGPVFSDRPIDIDVLLYDCEQIREPRLIVPHPLMTQREFVMKPLFELLVLDGDEKYLRLLAQVAAGQS